MYKLYILEARQIICRYIQSSIQTNLMTLRWIEFFQSGYIVNSIKDLQKLAVLNYLRDFGLQKSAWKKLVFLTTEFEFLNHIY